MSEQATEGSIGTTSIKATSADAEAHAGVSLTGLSAGGGANADVMTATQTIKLGPVTLSATGNVGIGAEASASLSTTGVSASAGLTPGFGGAVSASITSAKAPLVAGPQRRAPTRVRALRRPSIHQKSNLHRTEVGTQRGHVYGDEDANWGESEVGGVCPFATSLCQCSRCSIGFFRRQEPDLKAAEWTF